ncbi:phosphotransferase [Streptomyces sp. NPDC090106]|uniref:phosphotransferase n=1 Tax=Streptomyces sp. NPDC090106 TaxID=3365946 RepID=UPI0038296AEB
MKETPLGGGAVSGAVRVGPTVRRAPSRRSAYVRELLDLFERRGWPGAPRYLGRDERGRESLGFLPGRAALTPGERAAARTDETLAQVARLVREFHDLTEGTGPARGHEVVCHNDLAPKNTVYAVDGAAWRPVAFIDWDLAAPGERVWDLAHVCWQYLDLGPGVTDVEEAAHRVRVLRDAYGAIDGDRLLDAVPEWQDRCRRGIEAGAERGEPAMVGLRERGVVEELRAARAWVAAHREALGRFL